MTKICACGCNQEFTPTSPNQKFIDRSHQLAARSHPTADPCTAKLTTLERKHTQDLSELARLRRDNARLEASATSLQSLLDRYSTVKPADKKVPGWLTPKKTTKAHRATTRSAATCW